VFGRVCCRMVPCVARCVAVLLCCIVCCRVSCSVSCSVCCDVRCRGVAGCVAGRVVGCVTELCVLQCRSACQIIIMRISHCNNVLQCVYTYIYKISIHIHPYTQLQRVALCVVVCCNL